MGGGTSIVPLIPPTYIDTKLMKTKNIVTVVFKCNSGSLNWLKKYITISINLTLWWNNDDNSKLSQSPTPRGSIAQSILDTVTTSFC